MGDAVGGTAELGYIAGVNAAESAYTAAVNGNSLVITQRRATAFVVAWIGFDIVVSIVLRDNWFQVERPPFAWTQMHARRWLPHPLVWHPYRGVGR
ncbi:MAG: hypothetical protein KDB22_26625 [Planctomycetales bacterium]|nr:hypothetical protein [Planctomycetales bacterium]